MIERVKPKELTLQDTIEGDILKNVNKKTKELESRKSSLEIEIDKKSVLDFKNKLNLNEKVLRYLLLVQE